MAVAFVHNVYMIITWGDFMKNNNRGLKNRSLYQIPLLSVLTLWSCFRLIRLFSALPDKYCR